MDENIKNNEVTPPEWTPAFFWEDITFLLQRLLDFLRSLFLPPEKNH